MAVVKPEMMMCSKDTDMTFQFNVNLSPPDKAWADGNGFLVFAGSWSPDTYKNSIFGTLEGIGIMVVEIHHNVVKTVMPCDCDMSMDMMFGK